MIYLDHNATTPMRPEVVEAMLPFFTEVPGNPSSLHQAGQEAREAVDGARGSLATALGCAVEEVHFTSGGTEADNWAVKGVVAERRSRRGRQTAHGSAGRIVTSAIEHHAVWHSCEFVSERGEVDVEYVPVDASGRVDADRAIDAMDEETILVSIMHGNNETGVIQPLAEIGRRATELGIPFHVDAVQTLGKTPVLVDEMHADLVSVSAHKINGPKGTGALYVRSATPLAPLAHGGDHEGGMRAGTENVAGIVGFGKAMELRRGEEAASELAEIEELRDRLETGIAAAVDDATANGCREHRLPNTSNISFRGVEAEATIVGLDLEGIAVSSGSACTAGTAEPSHVLLAMGLEPRLAASSVRFSLGWGNTPTDIERLLEVLPPLVERLRRISV